MASAEALSRSGDHASRESFDVLVVGAGFSGLYALHQARELGFSAVLLEAAEGVGGTWFWNRYPGARCDVESFDYSLSFSEELEQEWEWTERYPAQPEILRYLNHVADRFELWDQIRLETRVAALTWGEEQNLWEVQTEAGDVLGATFCVLATGMLTVVNRPPFPGVEAFRGSCYHTARWPVEGVDLSGKRVGVIGTGSTGIQLITTVAREAEHVTVFQRTANFSLPAFNGPLEPELIRTVKAGYAERREICRMSPAGTPLPFNQGLASDATPEERTRRFEDAWQGGGFRMLGTYADLVVSPEANEMAADFVRDKIGATVTDPETAQRLMPRDYPIGTKRICVDTGYYETFNRDNVTLVDVREAPIQELTPTGIRTADAEYELDVVVFATGFDAMTGALVNIDIRGRDGVRLRDRWSDGPVNYLGLSVAGFPNLFTVTGPGSPSVLSNMVVSIEQHVEWIGACLSWMRERGFDRIEADGEAETAWVAHVAEVAAATLHSKANNWYNGANIPGKPRIFMPYVGGVGPYRQLCDDVAAKGYEGFAFSRSPVAERS